MSRLVLDPGGGVKLCGGDIPKVVFTTSPITRLEVDGQSRRADVRVFIEGNRVRATRATMLAVDLLLVSGCIGRSARDPMRECAVVAREGGRSEVIFTVFRRPDVSDAEFEADAGAVERDLRALRDLLERPR